MADCFTLWDLAGHFTVWSCVPGSPETIDFPLSTEAAGSVFSHPTTVPQADCCSSRFPVALSPPKHRIIAETIDIRSLMQVYDPDHNRIMS